MNYKRLFAYATAMFIGSAITTKTVPMAATQRGYWAVGGEWLIVPVLLLLVQIYFTYRDCKKEVEEVENGEK